MDPRTKGVIRRPRIVRNCRVSFTQNLMKAFHIESMYCMTSECDGCYVYAESSVCLCFFFFFFFLFFFVVVFCFCLLFFFSDYETISDIICKSLPTNIIFRHPFVSSNNLHIKIERPSIQMS